MSASIISNQPSYLKSAIDAIYGKDDDFILFGLTGRTGSGCSTVANILVSEISDIKHSLYSGTTPQNNDERKQKILLKHFMETWQSFTLIQVRSIITLFLLDKIDLEITEFIEQNISKPTDGNYDSLIKSLSELRVLYLSIPENGIANFYSNVLPLKCNQIRAYLGESSFVKLYQIIGINIRLSGDPFDSQLIKGKFFTIAEKINSVAKDIHKENCRLKKKTLIVIDAIRSPLEAIFFQDRYASFYLIAVSCPDEHRKARLRSMKISDGDIKTIDEQENKSRDPNDRAYYSVQDIPSCLQKSDIYISNPDSRDAVTQFTNLTNQIIRLTSLMKRPGLITPTPIERCMQIAATAKLNSGCISRQVGATITDQNFSVQSIGWNDAPSGQVPCNLRSRGDLLNGNDSIAYSTYEKNDPEYIQAAKVKWQKYTKIELEGRNISYCFKSDYNELKNEKNQVHTRSLHAEENAFLQISKFGGRGIENGKLFTTASPCELCAKKAYQLGIKDIYYIDPYPGIAFSHIIQGGSKNPTMHLFSGAIGRAFQKLYSPILAYKDELNALTQDE